MDVLKKINKMRIERNWSIYRLSVESGISQSTLTNMFNRETLPSITTLESICAAFGTTMSDFFADSNDENGDNYRELINLYSAAPKEVKESILVLLRQIAYKK